ncbi:MAG: hypothetical protein U1F55_09150 [Chitinivorax sp.]|jgi:hypothetical protein
MAKTSKKQALSEQIDTSSVAEAKPNNQQQRGKTQEFARGCGK